MPCACRLVVQLPVALCEGAAHRILTAEADWHSLRKKRCEGESFTCGPVQALAGFNRVAPLLQKPSHLGIKRKPGRNLRQQPAQTPQLIQG